MVCYFTKPEQACLCDLRFVDDVDRVDAIECRWFTVLPQ